MRKATTKTTPSALQPHAMTKFASTAAASLPWHPVRALIAPTVKKTSRTPLAWTGFQRAKATPSSPTKENKPPWMSPCDASMLVEIRSTNIRGAPRKKSTLRCGTRRICYGTAEDICHCWSTSGKTRTAAAPASLAEKAGTSAADGVPPPRIASRTCKEPTTERDRTPPARQQTRQAENLRHLQHRTQLRRSQRSPRAAPGTGHPTAGAAALPPRTGGGLGNPFAVAEPLRPLQRIFICASRANHFARTRPRGKRNTLYI